MGLLRLIKAFDLQKDVYSKIPTTRLEIPTPLRTDEEDSTLNYGRCQLAIIGQEKTGHILVTYNGYEQVG